MGRRHEKTFFQRRHTDGQQTHEKMLSITDQDIYRAPGWLSWLNNCLGLRSWSWSSRSSPASGSLLGGESASPSDLFPLMLSLSFSISQINKYNLKKKDISIYLSIWKYNRNEVRKKIQHRPTKTKLIFQNNNN